MKRFLVPVSLLATCVVFAACDDDPPQRPPKNTGFHPKVPPSNVENPPEPEPEPSEPKPPKTDPGVEPVVKNPVPDPVKVVGEVPYGKNVPGKPGFVTSPYSPYSGYIDVRGFPPGTEVKDPYSGKTFLVP
jgi:hypothetical protein